MRDVVLNLSQSWPIHAAELFLGWFPILFAMLVINSSRQFLLDRQGIVTQRLEPNTVSVRTAEERWPILSVLLSARNEENYLRACLDSVLDLRWPSIEVIVVDDGSTDATPSLLEEFRTSANIIVITHDEAKGKAASINEAFAQSQGDIVLVIDADAVLVPEVALLLAAQLEHHADVGAVTANPRVLCTDRLIQKLQAIEFSATVAAQRRSHASWGHISTMSGICTMFRRDAIDGVGFLDPLQPAEDIEMSWRLQSRGWRVMYEPAALVGTYGPATLRTWIRQRRRWAAGLMCALRANRKQFAKRSSYPVWPLLVEAVLSVIWCHLLVALTLFWALCLAYSVPPGGNSLVIGAWGAVAITVCTFQILWGIHLDKSFDRSIGSVALYTPLYPLLYWIMTATISVSATVPALARPVRSPVTWSPDRPD